VLRAGSWGVYHVTNRVQCLGNVVQAEGRIGHLTNYGQNTYFWIFWTFSHGGKFRNDTKPVSADCRDLRVSTD
jgi:hypothetical protein